jgi:2-(3-amino-3-carboxypropyl)histidine synthase
MKTSFEEANEKYDLEINKVIKTIKKNHSKKVLLQLPEGLKPYAQVICDKIEEDSSCKCIIWMGTCFGACDVPLDVDRLGVDLIVQFGHSTWNYSNKKDIKVI